MNLAVTVIEITAPVFMLAAVGFGWVKLGFEYRIQFVTQLAMTLAVPCLIFTALMQTQMDGAALSALTLASLAAYAGVTAISWAVVWALKLDRRTFLAPLIFGNTGNLGLPLALFAFGEAGLAHAVVIFAIMAIASFTFGIWLVSGSGALGKVLREPVVWATILGAVFLCQGWQTPKALTNALELIGQMAIPMMLITLGVALARMTIRGLWQAGALSLFKVALCVSVAWGVGVFFDLGHIAFGVLVLQVATPVAVTSYLLAQKFEADADSVAGLVVVSTLLSVLTLPLILAFVL